MVNQNKIIAWKWLKAELKRIVDPVLKKALIAEFRKRALDSWGYNPDTAFIKKQIATVDLDDWEKEFVADIAKAQQYEVDTRAEKRKQTQTEFKARMRYFVIHGGKFSDLPEDLQNEHILRGYLDVMFEEIQQCSDFLEKN